MFFVSILNIITFFFTYVVCFSITLDESPLYKEDFQSLNRTDYPETMSIENDDILAKIIRTFLIFGYIISLIMIIYVCKSTNKNQPSISE